MRFGDRLEILWSGAASSDIRDLEWWVKALRSEASMAGLCTLFVAVVVVFMVIVLKRYK